LIRLAVAVAGVSMLAAIAAGCGESSDGAQVALLLPGKHTSRNEGAIRPSFEAKIKEACEECEVIYRNAGGDFSKQKQQAKAALSQGADVLAIDPVYSEWGAAIVKEAEEKGVPVVNYGQIIERTKPDVFVSFSDVRNGELQTETLARKLKEEGREHGPVVMLNGEPGNPDEQFFQQGARQGLQDAGVQISAKRYYIPFWQASQAEREMAHAIEALGGDGFAGVYAETDGIAEGAIAAMKAAGMDPSERPTTGQGATLAGLKRILAGEQYLTIYEPVESEASVSAEIAAELAEGGEVPKDRATTVTYNGNNGTIEVPTIPLEPIVVTKDNVKQTVIADDLVSSSELCVGAAKAGCKAAGIPLE
jgi:D-xylose transport system substrate-binding protein